MKQTFISIKEVKKLIKAFQEKYNDLGCEGLPYYPEETEIDIYGCIIPFDDDNDIQMKKLATINDKTKVR